MGLLLSRTLPWLERWAHGRLPAMARAVADTADVVQEVATRVLRRLEGFEPKHRRALRAYLQQAVRNQIVDEIRRSCVRGTTVPLEDVVITSDDDPHALAVRTEAYASFCRALTRLKAEDREILVARLRKGYNFEQIALMTERRSSAAARMAFNRALERLLTSMKHP